MSIPFGSANFPDGLQGPASTPSSSTDPSSRSDNMRPADRLKSHPMPPHAADMPRVGRLNVSQPSSCSASDLPSHDQLFVLADLYFKHVNTWCPILDRNATIDLLSDLSALDESERVLIHAIVAVAMRFYPGGFLEEDTRNHYYAVARRKVLLQALEKPSMKSLQALVILTLDIHGTPEIDPSGNMLALTARIALQLRLHVERGISLVDASASPSIALPKPTSWRENESRRRLFWTVYTVDRYASLAANSDFIVREETVDRFLPSRYDLFSEDQSVETRWYDGPGRSKCLINHPENLGSFSYHCEILRTLSQIYNFLKKPIDIFSDGEVENWWKSYRELDSELNIWLADLPGDFSNVSKLCHSDPTSRISNWIILHGAFVTAVVRLHSCAAYPIASSHLFAPFVSASQKCLAAVGSLKEITQDAAKTGMLPLLGPQFAYALWVAARLLLLHAASTGGEVGDLYHSFAMTLGQMGQYWPVAHKYSQQLHKTRERSSPTDGTYGRSPSVELAAMRRWVPDTCEMVRVCSNI